MHVNIRPWPKNPVFSSPLNPPPVGLSIERIVIDLSVMEIVGRSFPKQRIFIPSDPDYCEPTPIQVGHSSETF